MRKLAFAVLLLLVALGASALNRVEETAQKWAMAWAADGVDVKTGFEADGTQNLAVLARAGYFPMKLTAKAGVKSVLRVYTNKTNDCSRVFTLPDLKVQTVLPAKGTKEFALPAMKRGQTLFGVCGMGMYSFEIVFSE